MIAAVAKNRVIGNGGDLIWHLPADQAFFLNRIKDALLLSGRTSYESGHGSVVFQDPERLIILTRQESYHGDGAYVVKSIEEAIKLAEKLSFAELAVLGGENVYEQLMDRVDTLYITEVHKDFEGDTFFPEIKPADWKETDRENFEADSENPYSFSFVTYKRISRSNVHNAKAQG